MTEPRCTFPECENPTEELGAPYCPRHAHYEKLPTTEELER